MNVLYTGRLTNGRIFDSSQLGPLDIDLDKVIRGWSEGLEKINRGGKIKLYIPPALAYGSEATSGIPPNSILIFEVELLDIKDQPPALKIRPPNKTGGTMNVPPVVTILTVKCRQGIHNQSVTYCCMVQLVKMQLFSTSLFWLL